MTPLAIECALWYYCRTADWDQLETGGTAQPEVIGSFVDCELLTEHPFETPRYRPTPRLHAYVEFLKSVPLPEERTTFHLPQSFIQELSNGKEA